MNWVGRILTCVSALSLFIVGAEPAHAEVSGISVWVISGATGEPDPSQVSENQIQFAIGFSDSAGASTIIFPNSSYGWSASGGGRVVGSGGSNPNSWWSSPSGPPRYMSAYDLRDLTPGTVYTISAWVLDHGQRFETSLNVTTKSRLSPPGAPTGVVGVPGANSIAVSWSAPSSTGGAAITGYTAIASPGGLTCTSTSLSCTIAGLSPGYAYTLTVFASNQAGAGSASAESSPVTLAGEPTQVAKPTATPAQGTSALPVSSPGATNAVPTELGDVDPSVDTVDGELVITRSGGLYRLRVETNSPETPFTVTARKPGAKVLKWSLDTKATGAVAFSTRRDLSGYIVRLRMEGQTLDVVTIPADRTS